MFSRSALLLSSFALIGACRSPRERPAELAHGALLAPGEASPPSLQSHSEFSDDRGRVRPWAPGEPLMHGFLGVSAFRRVEVEDGSVDGDEGDADELPTIGGGAQWKLGGSRSDFGLEGLLALSGRANAEAFVVGGGGAAVAIDVDLLLLELYGGPFASLWLGEKLRLYGAAGPLLQFADYQQTGGGLADDGSGFGYGYYGRAGLEFALPSRTLIGLGVRWSDSSVDLGGDLGDLELEGLQFLLTVSRWI
jgi:hypothetical protein